MAKEAGKGRVANVVGTLPRVAAKGGKRVVCTARSAAQHVSYKAHGATDGNQLRGLPRSRRRILKVVGADRC